MTDGGRRTVAPLVERLARIQDAHGWTNAAMAQQIGLSEPMWRMVRNGQARFGEKSLRAILRNFRELEREAVDYLVSGPERAA